MVVADFETGGVGSKGVGKCFQCGDTGGVVVRGGDVGTKTQDGEGPEWFPTQVCATAHREAVKECGETGVGSTHN